MIRRIYQTTSFNCLPRGKRLLDNEKVYKATGLSVAEVADRFWTRTVTGSAHVNAESGGSPFYDAPKYPVEPGFFQRVDKARLEALKNKYKREYENTDRSRTQKPKNTPKKK